jgi:uracil-DNA glycosylase
MNQSPQELLVGAKQIVEHLERSGLRMLPKPNEQWSSVWPLANSIRNVVSASNTSTPASIGQNHIADSSAVSESKTSRQGSESQANPILSHIPAHRGDGDQRDGVNAQASPQPPIERTASVSVSVTTESWVGKSLSLPERELVFDSLKEQVAACRKCEALACSRKQTVFGVGALQAKVVFFGEAPGADEDRQGEPFVGAAGQLLNKIMVAAKMKREEVYILNSLKCRPPGNRTPVDEEIANCRPFFQQQLEVLRPEYIVCLGAVAARAVLQSTDSVGRLRGRFHRYRDAHVLVTYHPAYLLRNESAKRFVWEDMQFLMKAMGIPIP